MEQPLVFWSGLLSRYVRNVSVKLPTIIYWGNLWQRYLKSLRVIFMNSDWTLISLCTCLVGLLKAKYFKWLIGIKTTLFWRLAYLHVRLNFKTGLFQGFRGSWKVDVVEKCIEYLGMLRYIWSVSAAGANASPNMEATIKEQIAALQAQLQAMHTNK